MSRPALAPGRYRHYKGNEYEVIGVATHSETGEAMVVYRALYGGFGLWVRPLAMFMEDVEIDGSVRPRFEYLSPSDVRKLSQEAQLRARAFLFEQARPLEQALYRWEFENGGEDDVTMALGAFANADGGFGHGLEPDLRTPDSSVIATTVALQVLGQIAAPPEHRLVQGAMRYLRESFDAENVRWPLIPATAGNAAHATWWSPGPEHATWFRQYAVNPRAELLGALYRYRELADEGILTAVERSLLLHFSALSQPLDMHETLCAIRLIETLEAPDDVRAAARAAVLAALPESMARTADEWEGYSLQPLGVAPSPQSALAADVAAHVHANLDFRILEQDSDGSWQPGWSWGDLYPEPWSEARRDWQGVLTLAALRQLAAYGRLAT